MSTVVLPETEQPASNASLMDGCLLVGIAAMVLRKVWDGQLQLYIHPRYTVFVTIAAIVLLVLGEIRLLQRSRNERSARRKLGVYGLLLLPLLLGMLVPPRPADTGQSDPQRATRKAALPHTSVPIMPPYTALNLPMKQNLTGCPTMVHSYYHW